MAVGERQGDDNGARPLHVARLEATGMTERHSLQKLSDNLPL